MKNQRALTFAEEQLNSLKSKSYSELASIIDTSESKIHDFDNGNYYQTQIQVFWDDPKEKKDIRVSCAIDGQGVSANIPLCTEFIMTPKGNFIE